MQVMHNLLISARSYCFATSFLRSISSDSLNYNSKRYFIRIMLINYSSINKNSYFSSPIIIKADLRVSLRLLRLTKISYSEISIDLYYQISQQTRSLCSDLSFVLFRTTIIRYNCIVLSICYSNSSRLASTITKSTRTKILIRRIILKRNITIRKIKNTISRKILRKIKIIISKSSFFRLRNLISETQSANNTI